MKKLMIIALLGATVGSAWGAARPEGGTRFESTVSADDLKTLLRSMSYLGRSQQQLHDEQTSTQWTPEMNKEFLQAVADLESQGKSLQEREEIGAKRLRDFLETKRYWDNPVNFWKAMSPLTFTRKDGSTIVIGDMGPLAIAALSSRNAPLEILLEKNFPLTINERNESAFHIAASRLDVKKLNMLLKHKPFIPNIKERQSNDPRLWKDADESTPYQTWINAKGRKLATGAPLGIDAVTIEDIEKKLSPL